MFKIFFNFNYYGVISVIRTIYWGCSAYRKYKKEMCKNNSTIYNNYFYLFTYFIVNLPVWNFIKMILKKQNSAIFMLLYIFFFLVLAFFLISDVVRGGLVATIYHSLLSTSDWWLNDWNETSFISEKIYDK